MKIRILGFAWNLHGNVSLADLRDGLNHESQTRGEKLARVLQGEIVEDWDGTYFALADHGPYWTGVVVKVRDQRQFCQIKREQGHLKLSAEQLAEGSKMVEINFFLVHAGSGKGLYQHYHQSTWVDSFGRLCKLCLDSHVSRKHAEIDKAAESQGWQSAEVAAQKASVTGTITHEILTRQENFEALVNGLQSISKVRIALRDDNIAMDEFGILKDNAHRTTLEFNYGPDTPWAQIKQGIFGAVGVDDVRRVRVEGLSANGHEEIINLTRNLASFAEMDFDEATEDLDIDLGNLAASLEQSPMIARLLELAATPRLQGLLAV